MKFRTIDIEGDGIKREINQQLFPEGNHFDPGTIMWCVTFCDQDYNTLTLVKKLPETSRYIKNGISTQSVHYKDTIVPSVIDGHEIKEFTDWTEFIKEIIWQIMISEGNVYSKGYGKYNFDAQVLKANIERNHLYDGVSHLIKTVNPTKWDKTHPQVTERGTRNQIFIERGIRHNIEDAIQLAQRINNNEVKQ